MQARQGLKGNVWCLVKTTDGPVIPTTLCNCEALFLPDSLSSVSSGA